VGSESGGCDSLFVTRVGSASQVKYLNAVPKQGRRHFHFCSLSGSRINGSLICLVAVWGDSGAGKGCNLLLEGAGRGVDFLTNNFFVRLISYSSFLLLDLIGENVSL